MYFLRFVRRYSIRKTLASEVVRKKMIMMEFEALRATAIGIPEHLSEEDLMELCRLPDKNSRLIYLQGLKRESEKTNLNLSKQLSPFNLITEERIKDYLIPKLTSCLLWGQPLVIDMGFHSYMTYRQKQELAQQIKDTFQENAMNNNSFNLYFCNFGEDNEMWNILKADMPFIFNDSYPINITSKTYFECFSRDRLVYLSPYSRKHLSGWHEDCVYILGGVVSQQPLSLAKAKKQGLTIYSIPVDMRYSQMRTCSLSLQTVLRLLLKFRDVGNWTYALEDIPEVEKRSRPSLKCKG